MVYYERRAEWPAGAAKKIARDNRPPRRTNSPRLATSQNPPTSKIFPRPAKLSRECLNALSRTISMRLKPTAPLLHSRASLLPSPAPLLEQTTRLLERLRSLLGAPSRLLERRASLLLTPTALLERAERLFTPPPRLLRWLSLPLRTTTSLLDRRLEMLGRRSELRGPRSLSFRAPTSSLHRPPHPRGRTRALLARPPSRLVALPSWLERRRAKWSARARDIFTLCRSLAVATFR